MGSKMHQTLEFIERVIDSYYFVGIMLGIVICINVIDSKRSSKLTEYEREEEDDQQEIERRLN
jgi:hypothetical protein